MESRASKKYKILKTVLMNFAPIALGIYLEIVGPTLPDLIQKLGIDYEKYARILVARSVGYFISALLAGLLGDTLPRHLELMLAVALGIAAIATGLAPWTNQLWVLAFLFHLQGLGQGSIDTFGNYLCARMWGKRASMPLHGLHLSFGIGAMIAPQIARPFISNTAPDQGRNITLIPFAYGEANNSFTDLNGTGIHKYNSSDHSTWDSLVFVPYLISSIVSALLSIVFLSFYVYEKTANVTTDAHTLLKVDIDKDDITETQIPLQPEVENEEQEYKISLKPEVETEKGTSLSSTDEAPEKKEEPRTQNSRLKSAINVINPSECTGGDTMFGIQAFALIFLYYGNVVGGERIYGKFIYSYALESDNNMDRDAATLVNSLFWIFFTLGRALAVILSKYVHPRNLIISNLVFNIISGVCLSIWGFSQPIILYTFSCLLGMVLSPLYPNCMAWINQYIELKAMVIALLSISSACGGMIYQWLGGYMFQYHGARTMMYIIMGYALALSTVFALLLLIVRDRPTRFQHTTVTMKTLDETET